MKYRIIGSPWKDRIGRICFIVPAPSAANMIYPWSGLFKDEVVVYIPDDAYPEKNVPIPWSCVIKRSDIEPVP